MNADVCCMISYSLEESSQFAIYVLLKSGTEAMVLRSAIAALSEAQIEALALSALGVEMHAHWNDDGSLAIAFGTEPEVWPEDMIE